MEPLFLEQADWRRFALLFAPADKPRKAAGTLLFVPPFAEEMNKSRRTVALGARALAANGWTVLLFDPLGCGDSPGDFGDASWDAWVDDVVRAHRWLRERSDAPVGLWALRSGALLAAAALPVIGSVPTLVLWQPITSGKVQLQQFLRLKVAAAAIAGGTGKTNTRALLDELGRGTPIEVAGYMLSPALALRLQGADLAPTSLAARLAWLEVTPWDPAVVSPASEAQIDAWRGAVSDVVADAVRGPAFWLTQEIEECPALIDATVRCLTERAPQ
jgi:exosortase A-associated hydrolase 2